ncbi:MAG: twin-arginine translocation pathway signal [Cyanobium sp.]
MAEIPPLSRRRLLRLGASTGLGLAALNLTGCVPAGPRLLGSRGDLPSAWSSLLPRAWTVELLDDPAAVLGRLRSPTHHARSAPPRPAMVQLGDGWATSLPSAALQAIGTTALQARLDPRSQPVARLFQPPGAPLLAFPWSRNPWVLVLRSRPDLARRQEEGWDLLLDPSLQGRLVLPSSPRVNLALMAEDPERLLRLRRQALAYDDRDALSLLLSGDAEAAVLPRQRVVPLLRRDPRLAVVLPPQGGPLSWNLLLQPAGAAAAPLEWLGDALDPPLLTTLLAAGWAPPLPGNDLEHAAERLSAPLRPLMAPPAAVLARWRDLPPLSPAERERLQTLWDGAALPRS